MPKTDVHVQLIKKELLIVKERKGNFMSEEKPTIREKLVALKDRFNTWRYSHVKPSKNESNKVTDEDLESASVPALQSERPCQGTGSVWNRNRSFRNRRRDN